MDVTDDARRLSKSGKTIGAWPWERRMTQRGSRTAWLGLLGELHSGRRLATHAVEAEPPLSESLNRRPASHLVEIALQGVSATTYAN